MKLPDWLVRRATVEKKKKAAGNAESSRKRPRSPTPSRSPTRSPTPVPLIRRPQGHREQPLGGQELVLLVDLTVDTPPEGSRAEATPSAEEPTLPDAGPPCPGVELAQEEVPLAVQAKENQATTGLPTKEGTPAFDAALAASNRTGTDKGDELEAIPSRPSLINQGRMAKRLTANSIVAMRDTLVQAEEALRQFRQEAAKVQAQAKRAERALKVARVERAKELYEVKRQAKAELERLRKRLEVVEMTIGAQDLRIQSLGIKVEVAEKRASNAEEIAQGSNARAAGMEETIRRAEEKAKITEERALAAEGKVAVTEGKATTNEEKVATMVDKFQRSTTFAEELAEASSGAYLLSFWDGKEKVSRVYGLSGLDDLKPNEMSEGSTASPGPIGDGSGPTAA